MKSSELDKANGTYKEWLPEVGQHFKYAHIDSHLWESGECIFKGNFYIVAKNGKWETPLEIPSHKFRPIQTQEDKEHE